MNLVSNNINESLSDSVVSSIVFVSDLHFDFVDGEYRATTAVPFSFES